jgi:hypothetical protein
LRLTATVFESISSIESAFEVEASGNEEKKRKVRAFFCDQSRGFVVDGIYCGEQVS